MLYNITEISKVLDVYRHLSNELIFVKIDCSLSTLCDLSSFEDVYSCEIQTIRTEEKHSVKLIVTVSAILSDWANVERKFNRINSNDEDFNNVMRCIFDDHLRWHIDGSNDELRKVIK